jgi:prepilin-type N-terminal cleavage/methylation domain-containing protein
MESIILKRNRSGFTLLELLIVIAIIGILVTIGAVSYSSAQKKSRDSRRQADMKAVQGAWEQYYADNNGSYPASCSVAADYLPAGLPGDPKTGDAYEAACADDSYCFCGAMEAGTGNADETCDYTASPKTHYCVSNLQ